MLAPPIIYILILFAACEGFLERRVAVASGKFRLCAAHHHIASVGQCALRQRLERVASHDNRMSRGECLEAFQVVGEPIQQFVLVAYGTVLCHGGDDGNHILKFRFFEFICFLRFAYSPYTLTVAAM